MIDTLRAEHTKLWTLTSARWLLVATGTALVAVGAAIAATLDPSQCGRGMACTADPVKASLSGVWVAQLSAVLLGVLAMSSEYEPPQVRVTLAAMPRRLPVLAAKAVVVAGVVAVAAGVGTAGALVAGRTVLGANGFSGAAGAPEWSLTAGSSLRAGLGTVGYLVLVAVLALGIAALVRDGAVAAAAVLAALFLFPMLGVVVDDPTWQHRIQRYAPMNAGLTAQATRDLDHLAIAPWVGLAVLAGYAAATLVVGTATFLVRDA